jgi:cytochrome c-type biogenesis protein CcmF
MIPELGHFALILALALALVQTLSPLTHPAGDLSHKGRGETKISLVKSAALGQLFFVLFAFACLAYAFISNDFSVVYVAENSNTHLPLPYRIGAIWGAHEGSLLLWITILSIWTAAVALFNKNLTPKFTARVLAILGLVSSGFLLFLLFTSNPFQRLLPNFPTDGADLNPLLQDPGLVGHPPMLYMGYVGFAVAFAFSLAALWSGKMDSAWARWARPWTIAAWCFLTLGITLGSWWAYRELGWGGWWFWDPVENASLLPWLSGTALIHSLIVTEKRETFKSWTALLAIITFSLSLIGTFLVRSGVLISVHAFANDPARGAFLLQLLAIVIGGSLLLYAARATSLKSSAYFALISRETFLLSNNVLLVSITATVLLGTLYPLILDALNLGKISVGPPYFNTVFVPLMVPLLFFMGIGPLCYWYESNKVILVKQLLYPFVLAIILSASLLLVCTDKLPILVWLGLFLAFWIMLTTIISVLTQKKKWTRQRWGMIVAHMGIAVCVIGITLTTHYQLSRDVRMQPGDQVTLGLYNFQFLGVNNLQGPNYSGTNGEFLITKDHKFINLLHAQKRLYTVEQVEMTESAIDVGLTRDLYIALGDSLNNDAWGVRIYYKPFIRFIWWGGLLMVLGGVLAIRRVGKACPVQ